MKILILGIDGYLGWPLALRLARRGHKVSGMDNESRRKAVQEIGSDSLIPIASQPNRLAALLNHSDDNFGTWYVDYDVTHYGDVEWVIRETHPDTIIHFAEQPSAPYSMRGWDEAWGTMANNIHGTLNVLYAMKKYAPAAHLIKLGTMGEYGTPDCAIPEGLIPDKCLASHSTKIRYNGDMTYADQGCPIAGLPFPYTPGSWYHATKCHDSINIRFACRTWGLRATDIMQGVVYGSSTKETRQHPDLATRFDYDQYFGTVINRFCAQAVIGYPLTIYGTGDQKRSFLPIEDSMQCLTLLAENPPLDGEYRVVNQFSDVFSIWALTNLVGETAAEIGLSRFYPTRIPNPRVEAMHHKYMPVNSILKELGFRSTEHPLVVIRRTLEELIPHKNRIDQKVISPTTTWWD